MNAYFPDWVGVWISLAAVFILEGLALYIWQYRDEPGARWQSWLQGFKGFWLFVIVLLPYQSGSAAIELCLVLYTLAALASDYSWYHSLLEMSRYPISTGMRRGVQALLLLFCLLTATNFLHHLIWKVGMVQGKMDQILQPVGYVGVAYAYLMMIFSFWINLWWTAHRRGLQRRQAMAFLLPTLVSWFGEIHELLLPQSSTDFHAVGFLLAGLCTSWAFFRWRTHSILPLAQKKALQLSMDGLMVVDDSDFIVAINAAAQEIFPKKTVHTGARFSAAVAHWSVLTELQWHNELAAAELRQGEELRYFHLRKTDLHAANRTRLGYVLAFKDVTREKHQQESLLDQKISVARLHEGVMLGRELHDGPGQLWNFIGAQSQAARIHLSNGHMEKADQILEQLQQVIQSKVLDLRESIENLHKDSSRGLVQSLEEQARWYQVHCGMNVHLQIASAFEEGILTAHSRLHILRILQEALSNARKHAEAGKIKLRIELCEDGIEFSVDDDGLGFDREEHQREINSHGLNIMEERAREIGAQLWIDSRKGMGCRVVVLVPFAQMYRNGNSYRELACTN